MALGSTPPGQAAPAGQDGLAADGDVAALVDREKEFFDTKGSGLFRILRLIIWRAIGEFNRDKEIEALYDAAGKHVLLYGCGNGGEAPSLLRDGAVDIRGFDISETEIAGAQANAVAGGYADRVEFRTADAHQMPYDEGAFDLIIGNAILHHLDLDLALAELRRVLRPGGIAVFREPLVHNPLLRLGRALTPAARTDDEHPFTVDDWKLCESYFPNFTHREVELISIPLMPLNLLLPRALQRRLARRVAATDDRLFARWPGLRKHARTTLLTLA
jgi:SAM-dependent methyltransferase